MYIKTRKHHNRQLLRKGTYIFLYFVGLFYKNFFEKHFGTNYKIFKNKPWTLQQN